MMIASGKNSGKRLVNYILREIDKNGYADVVALSDMGVEKIHRAGQKAADKSSLHIEALPRQMEFKLDNVYKESLVVRFIYKDGGAE